MSEFINTADIIGDDEMCDQIIAGTVTEYKENRITTVGGYAFYGCNALTTVDVPNVTTIGSAAFYGCSALISLNLPKASNLNAQNCFNGCSSLEHWKLPEATGVYTNCFTGCTSMRTLDFTKITAISCSIPSTVLNALIIRNSSRACTLSGTITAAASGVCFIYVPRALVDTYKSATNWSTYASQFRALEDYTVDGTVTGELDESKI